MVTDGGREGGREGEREGGKKRQVYWGGGVIHAHIQLVRPAIPGVIDKSQSINVLS